MFYHVLTIPLRLPVAESAKLTEDSAMYCVSRALKESNAPAIFDKRKDAVSFVHDHFMQYLESQNKLPAEIAIIWGTNRAEEDYAQRALQISTIDAMFLGSLVGFLNYASVESEFVSHADFVEVFCGALPQHTEHYESAHRAAYARQLQRTVNRFISEPKVRVFYVDVYTHENPVLRLTPAR